VAEPEQVVERLQPDARGLGEIAARRQPADEHPERGERPSRPLRTGAGDHVTDPGAPIDTQDVDAAQPERTSHSGLRSDRFQLNPHTLEHLS
jgi:hypothetical protein